MANHVLSTLSKDVSNEESAHPLFCRYGAVGLEGLAEFRHLQPTHKQFPFGGSVIRLEAEEINLRPTIAGRVSQRTRFRNLEKQVNLRVIEAEAIMDEHFEKVDREIWDAKFDIF